MPQGDAYSSKLIKFKVTPRIILRSEHIISRANIDERALKVLYRLKNAGYKAYLVGGSVRDLLLGREPKDFDVATDALPEQIRELFRTCHLIGRRFRLAHIHFGNKVIEVATFRAQHADGKADRIVEEAGSSVIMSMGISMRTSGAGILPSMPCTTILKISPSWIM